MSITAGWLKNRTFPLPGESKHVNGGLISSMVQLNQKIINLVFILYLFQQRGVLLEF
jgi:nicotinamide mononucleotide (NMN) deamidase PncC